MACEHEYFIEIPAEEIPLPLERAYLCHDCGDIFPAE